MMARQRAGNGKRETRANALAPFVSRLTLEMAELGDGHVHSSIDGSMLSADISGFTALSERLADKGREGAEELTRLINTCFVALIDAAYGYGGEVLKFGGDAVLLIFRGEAHRRRAGRAAQAMQIALRSTAAARQAKLTMTVGVAEGPFDAFLVGTDQRDLLVSGRAATEVIRLESSAAQGETLASAAIADSLDERHADGTSVIWDHPTAPKGRMIEESDDLTPYVPLSVADQLSAFADVGGEHRLVAVGFVMISGVDSRIGELGGEATATALGELIDEVYAACSRFGVTVLHSDIAEDGLKLVLCAGAPLATATPGDALLQSALQISSTSSPFVVRQGVQVGRVFAGFLGSEYRRTYTLMGDPVNTAARMLGKADDRDVIAVHDVILETRSVFIDEELEPFTVKGKTAPIIAHRILQATNEVRRRGDWIPFVGRQSELAIIDAAVVEDGAFIDLVGAGGSGKSRLIEETAERIDLSGFLRFQAVCSPYSETTPYSLMRLLFRNGLGVDIHLDDESTGELLTKVVQQFAPALEPSLPLLAIALGADVASTPEFEALAVEHRRDRIHDAVVEFLDTAFERPIALVAEDVHWIDDASRDLLAHIAKHCISGDAAMERRGIVVTTRPEDMPAIAEIEGGHTIDVGPLDDDSIRAIVLGNADSSLGDQQVAAVVRRAAGNPLFAIELARIVSNGSGDHLPDSVEKLISARLDRLSPDARRFLRIAAVVGVEMTEIDLQGVLALEAPHLRPPWDEVAEFMHRRGDGTVAFANIVTHDAAYEGLPFKTRRHIHLTIGDYIENRAQDPNHYAPLLARHFSEARDHPRTWRYGRQAGDAALAEGANVEAASNYGRALASARYVRNLGTDELIDVAMKLGSVFLVLGDFQQARSAWQHARNKNDDLATELAIMRQFGVIEQNEGELSAAVRWFNRAAAKISESDNQDEALGERVVTEQAKLLLARAAIHVRKGEFQETGDVALQALRFADQTGDLETRAFALDRLQISVNNLRLPDDHDYGPQAFDAFEELGDHAGMARVLNNMGVGAYYRGDWNAAADHYARSMDHGVKAGALVDGVFGGLNAGEILSDQGHWDRAREVLSDAHRNWASVGYPVGVAASQLFLGVVERRCGNWALARELLSEASEGITAVGLDELGDDAATRLLEVDVYSSKADSNTSAELLARLGVDNPLAGRAKRLHALALFYEGADVDSTCEMLSSVADESEGFERLLTLRALIHVGSDRPLRAEADEIAKELGVVQTARLPRRR